MALITIFIGWFVGRGVRWGSEGRGGRVYQAMGAVFTYVWCMMAYLPDVVAGLNQNDPELNMAVAVIVAPFVVLTLPFKGVMGPLGTLILGFGVWRGWREPARIPIVVEGPFALAAPPAVAPQALPPPDLQAQQQ